ncbi:MAG TPA: MMPL family transporter, partial [Caulobacteraceae bacterium]
MTSPDRPTSPPRFVVERWVAICADHAWFVVATILAVAAVAVVYVASHFAMTSDTQNLLSTHLKYRERAHVFDALFQPEGDQIVIVIDGRTPELAESAAARLTEKLQSRRDLFRDVRRPESGFFMREGLLYLSPGDVQNQMKQLIAAQPFLGPLAQDPSLRGLMTTLGTAMQGVTSGQAQLAQLDRPITNLAATFDDLRSGRPAFFSWGALISGQADKSARLRQLVMAAPLLNFAALKSGAHATKFVRQSAQALQLDPDHGVRVRLTGPIPLQDQQFGSIVDGVALIALMALIAIVAMLWLAVRAPRLIGAILLTMLIGLVAAMAIGLLMFHRFNVISVAFIPLFVGLGIDFGIQFTVRFRWEHGPDSTARAALCRAAAGMGRPLLLAATAIAVGFLAFAPTAYLGVSQLWVIAGVGMFVAVALNLTFLPALIRLLDPPTIDPPGPGAPLERLDGFILSHRRLVIGVALVGALASAAALPLLRFDFNPFHLEDKHSEPVSTLLELMRDPDQSPNSLEIVAPSLSKADVIAARVRQLPEVASARTLSSFVPADQAPKLAAIRDASDLMSFSLDPPVVSPPPSDQEVIASLSTTAAALRTAAATDTSRTGAAARRLAEDLDWLAGAPPSMRARATEVLIPGLKLVLEETRAALTAQPISLRTLPPELVRDWLARDGRARVSMAPRGDSNDNAVLDRFITAVSAIYPNVT